MMSDAEEISPSSYVPVLVGERTFYVEAVPLDEEEEVAARAFDPEDFTQSIGPLAETVSDAVMAGLGRAKPDKVAVEFGCEVGMDSGNLTAILVKGTLMRAASAVTPALRSILAAASAAASRPRPPRPRSALSAMNNSIPFLPS